MLFAYEWLTFTSLFLKGGTGVYIQEAKMTQISDENTNKTWVKDDIIRRDWDSAIPSYVNANII